MSRHLIIRCDAPGCAQQTETSASDTAPTSIDVPAGWLTLLASGQRHRHYCSEACLHATYAAAASGGNPPPDAAASESSTPAGRAPRGHKRS